MKGRRRRRRKSNGNERRHRNDGGEGRRSGGRNSHSVAATAAIMGVSGEISKSNKRRGRQVPAASSGGRQAEIGWRNMAKGEQAERRREPSANVCVALSVLCCVAGCNVAILAS